jgi:hypothetical protein
MQCTVSTTLIVCPGCNRDIPGPTDKPLGKHSARCVKCKTIFDYEVAFVSPPAIQKGPPVDIDSTDADDNGWQQAVEDLDAVLSMCDDVPERGEDFADSVRDGAIDMQEWIKKEKYVSADQRRSIENWKDGLMRWIH